MKSYEHNPVPCRGCGHELQAATPVNGGGADLDGAYSVCVYCNEVAIFTVVDDQVVLVEPSLAELEIFQATFGSFIRQFNRLQSTGPFWDEELGG